MNNRWGSKGYFKFDKVNTVLIMTQQNLIPMAAKQAANDITLLVQQILE
ncbi:hypothetical protein HH682_07545 [Rosenbergiella sp. S61]|uniref:Beta-lactamase n=1 Tax=Rosenbergiella gaditana TaxID=2726987 RepID=A0ABS5SXT5_9GAMM|nr:hypothetical protein [Rosenbergiella gaditana]MBT0724293.1 hypothetical protein [Rosenbergiella gaditana]